MFSAFLGGHADGSVFSFKNHFEIFDFYRAVTP